MSVLGLRSDSLEKFRAGACRLLALIRAEDLTIELRKGTVCVGPRERVDDDMKWLINTTRLDLTALVAAGDEDVAWRASLMLRQLILSGLRWPCQVPSLIALPGARPNPEDCRSCAELLDVGEGDSYLCGACGRAKDIALSLWIARPAQTERTA